MQFNSVQSGSFLTGAKSVNENVTDIYNTAIQTGFAADQVIMQANANDAVKQVAAARRQASMANAAIDTYATAKVQDMKDKLPGQLKDIGVLLCVWKALTAWLVALQPVLTSWMKVRRLKRRTRN